MSAPSSHLSSPSPLLRPARSPPRHSQLLGVSVTNITTLWPCRVIHKERPQDFQLPIVCIWDSFIVRSLPYFVCFWTNPSSPSQCPDDVLYELPYSKGLVCAHGAPRERLTSSCFRCLRRRGQRRRRRRRRRGAARLPLSGLGKNVRCLSVWPPLFAGPENNSGTEMYKT